MKVLTKTNSICQFDTALIQKIHEEFSDKLAINYTQPSVSKVFKIAGIDLNGYIPTIEKGLLNLDIGIDDKGVYSTYEFGTRLMQIPSEDSMIFLKNILGVDSRPGSYTNTVNHYPILGQPNTP